MVLRWFIAVFFANFHDLLLDTGLFLSCQFLLWFLSASLIRKTLPKSWPHIQRLQAIQLVLNILYLLSIQDARSQGKVWLKFLALLTKFADIFLSRSCALQSLYFLCLLFMEPGQWIAQNVPCFFFHSFSSGRITQVSFLLLLFLLREGQFEITPYPLALGILLKLFNKASIGIDLYIVWFYLAAFALHDVEHFFQGILELLDQIGRHDGHASANPRHAVHQDVRLLAGGFDEVVGLSEVTLNGVFLVVFGREVEVERDGLLAVLQESAARGRENCLNALGCMWPIVPWRRGKFWAAAKLEMKMEPRPVMLSKTHSMSHIVYRKQYQSLFFKQAA